MKLKYILPVIALMAFTACDSVDEADRYIQLPTVEVTRGVLVEDFTGQSCTNCPTAHNTIEQLQEQYGDAFIPVSIHAGVQSISIDSKRRLGLAAPIGTIYDNAAGIAAHGYPSIVVNYGSTVYVGTGSQWVDAVRSEIQKKSTVQLKLDAWYETDPEGCTVIKTRVTSLSPDALDLKLQLWLVEDGIVAPQTGVDGKPGYDNTYVHNNVLRAALNGDWGQPLVLTPGVWAESENEYSVAGEWEKSWVIDRCRVIAFVYTDASGVLQATTSSHLTNR